MLIIIEVVPVGEVEVETFPCEVVILVVPVGDELEVKTVPCAVVLLVVPVGVVEVVTCF